MKSDIQELDILMVDRLVDGELTDEERRSLLLACEQHPQLWRQVALAFVESQAFSEDLMLAATPAISAPDQPVAKRSLFFDPRIQSFLGMAAAVLLAISLGFGVGTLSNSWRGQTTQGGSVASNSTQEPNIDGQQSTEPTPRPDALYMLVRDQDYGGLKPLEIPIDQSADGDFAARFPASSVPMDLVHQLEQAGHDVQQTTRYHTLRMNGRKVVVPIDGVRVNFQKYQ